MQSSFSEGSKVIRIAHEHAKRCRSFRKALRNVGLGPNQSPDPDAEPQPTSKSEGDQDVYHSEE